MAQLSTSSKKEEASGCMQRCKHMHYKTKGLIPWTQIYKLGLPADARTYEIAAEMLKTIGYDELYLLTNNPEKRLQLVENGIKIKDRVPIIVVPSEHNLSYLRTKASRMGHILEV